MRRFSLVVLALSLLTAACSSDSGEELIALRASVDPAVGDSRFLFAINEIDGKRRGSPEELVTVTAKPLDDPDAVIEVDAEFVWMVPEAIGLYKAELPWDRSGQWEIDWEISTGEKTQPFLVLVQDQPTTVAAGDDAPRVPTPTLDDTDVEDLTTDFPVHEPFYELSLDEALANGRKTVAIFATPAYCTSAACGPMMLQTKEISAGYPEVNWVHIEVYEGFNDDGFAPDLEHLAPAVVEYKLPSEPWIFVMDESGVIMTRIEGVLAEGELESVLET